MINEIYFQCNENIEIMWKKTINQKQFDSVIIIEVVEFMVHVAQHDNMELQDK